MAYLPQRKALRLPEFDYASPGAYFVTICTLRKRHLFGRIVDGRVLLSEMGRIAEQEWLITGEKRSHVSLDAYVIMPNHVHGLVFIREHGRTKGSAVSGAHPCSLPSIVGGYKAAASRRIARLCEGYRCALWQRSYHEHVVRNSRELNLIRAYIANNPMRWQEG